MERRRSRILAVLLAGCAGTALVSGAGAQDSPTADAQRGATPPARMRAYDPTKIIMKVKPGVSQQEVLNRVIAGDKESFQGGIVQAQPFANGAFVLDVGALMRVKESTADGGRYALEPIGGPKEAAAPGSLDDLIARLAADPDVAYVQKNYIMHAHQGADALNDMIGGGTSRRTEEPRREEPPPAPRLPGAPETPEAPADTASDVLPNDPRVAEEWHLRNFGPQQTAATSPGGVGFPIAWRRQSGSDDIVVAVLDTGLLLDHEDFGASANVLPGADLLSDPFIANDGDGRDQDPYDVGDATAAGECGDGWPEANRPDSWHGSNVAGIVGGASTNNGIGAAGGAWNVKILPVRVLGKCGGTLQDIGEGILWAAGIPVEGLPANPNPAHIINMSLGGGGACTPFYQDVIDQVVARGVTVVVSAGNEADDAANYQPAGCHNVVSVAASDARGHLSPYSNWGQMVDILAPGGDIGRDDDGDGNPDGVLGPVKGGYDFYNGTSMAAPVVAAAVALLKSSEPNLTPAEVEGRLKQFARPRSAEECGQPCGAGLIDVGTLIQCSPLDAAGQECGSAAVAAAGRRTVK